MWSQVALEASLQTKLLDVTVFQLTYFKSWKMMLWKCCTQCASKFGKLSSGHRTGKGQFSFQFQRKAMPKNAQTTAQLHSSPLQCSCLENPRDGGGWWAAVYGVAQSRTWLKRLSSSGSSSSQMNPPCLSTVPQAGHFKSTTCGTW